MQKKRPNNRVRATTDSKNVCGREKKLFMEWNVVSVGGGGSVDQLSKPIQAKPIPKARGSQRIEVRFCGGGGNPTCVMTKPFLFMWLAINKCVYVFLQRRYVQLFQRVQL